MIKEYDDYLVLFIPYIAPSLNKILNEYFKVWNKRMGTYLDRTKQFRDRYIEETNIIFKNSEIKKINQPIFISYYPILGSEKQNENDKMIKKSYDVDNYIYCCKCITDALKNKEIFEDDCNKYIKSIFVNESNNERILKTSGMIVIIEKQKENNFPDLKKQEKIKEKFLNDLIKGQN
jgi:hypothetical protein